jgi:hypothetical protein
VPFVLNSESLNLLEPSGAVQTCNGVALPLTLRNMKRKNTSIFSIKEGNMDQLIDKKQV